jgi:D-citramalate synthase
VDENISVLNYSLSLANELKPVASLKIRIGDEVFEETSNGDGQYDAFMKALRKIYGRKEKSLPVLIDYSVSIPPGGRTDALVQTVITWRMGREFKTRGLDSDQTVAAIKATVKMLNIIEK